MDRGAQQKGAKPARNNEAAGLLFRSFPGVFFDYAYHCLQGHAREHILEQRDAQPTKKTLVFIKVCHI
jgi:hypothetical protein